MDYDPAPFVSFVQGFVELDAKKLVRSSPFLLILQLWVAIVMVIVAMSRQSIGCMLNPDVCGSMKV